MTREEAIKIFQVMKKIMSIPNSDAARTIEAIDMAIEALTNVHNLHSGDLISREDAVNANGDLIYRADAIEAIQNAYCKPCKERGDDHNEVRCRACAFDDAMNQIDSVPSAKGGDAEMNETKPQYYMRTSPITGADLISRADAIEAVCDGCVWYKTASCKEGKEEWECSQVNKIRHLPSADAVQGCSGDEEPGQWQTENGKPSKAEFSVYCSKCGSWSEYRTKYCGNCGSLMKEENNEKY